MTGSERAVAFSTTGRTKGHHGGQLCFAIEVLGCSGNDTHSRAEPLGLWREYHLPGGAVQRRGHYDRRGNRGPTIWNASAKRIHRRQSEPTRFDDTFSLGPHSGAASFCSTVLTWEQNHLPLFPSSGTDPGNSRRTDVRSLLSDQFELPSRSKGLCRYLQQPIPAVWYCRASFPSSSPPACDWIPP